MWLFTVWMALHSGSFLISKGIQEPLLIIERQGMLCFFMDHSSKICGLGCVIQAE